MRNLRLLTLVASMLFGLLLLMTFSFTNITMAQDEAVGTPPVILTPGANLGGFVGPVVDATLTFNSCYTPFPLIPGDVVYIEPGVNIRVSADFSSPIVWNTSLQQFDDDGTPLEDNEQYNVTAYIVDGPICSNGYNWWRVNVAGGNDGWVAEGRPTDPGGYLFRTPGIDFDIDCTPIFDLVSGEIATVTQNVRVRVEPNQDSRVRTVAPVGSDILIISGPQCDSRSGIVWFEVRVTVVDFTYQGWMAQGAGGAVWLIPTDLPSEEAGTACGNPLSFDIGALGYVNSFERRSRHLRNAPGLDSSIRYLLVDGVPFEFIGGPVCANNINWWQIRVRSSNPVEGWIAEGSPGVGYWLSETDPNEFAR